MELNKEVNGNLGIAYRALEQYRDEMKKEWENGETRMLFAEVANIKDGIDKISDILSKITRYANYFEAIALRDDDSEKEALEDKIQ